MKVELFALTAGVNEHAGRSPEELIIYQARVSSKRKDQYEDPAKLLRWCIMQGHWSVFEMANVTFRIETSRAIAREILRHDMSFQELSQRYAKIDSDGYEQPEQRKQADKNRQSSTEPMPDMSAIAQWSVEQSVSIYNAMIKEGASRETARMVLPECMTSYLYANNNVRGWLSFLNSRLHHTAQYEMQQVAAAICDLFIQQFPIVSEACNNFKGADQYHILSQVVIMANIEHINDIKALWGR